MMAAMLETSSNAAAEAHEGQDALESLHGVIERLQADVKFKQTKIEALIFEIARLKRWRFGSSSESLDGIGAQAVLFDQIVADTRAEDAAALAAAAAAVPSLATPASVEPRRPVRQALPESLAAHRTPSRTGIDGLRLRPAAQAHRPGRERAAGLRAGTVLRAGSHPRPHRGRGPGPLINACACCQTIQAAPLPAQIIDKGIPAPGLLALQAASGQRPDPS